MRIRPAETSGLPMPFQRRSQQRPITGRANPLAWADRADGALHAWDFIADAARWNGAYVGALANTPNWTFTRASTGYAQNQAGVLIPFASGALRRTDKGVLIEGARTNLCLQSQTFDNATWAKTNVTVTPNAIAAPDGTLTGAKVEVATTATTAIHQQNIVVAATAATASIYVKRGNNGAADCDDFLIRNITTATTIAGGKFDWTTGIFTASAGGSATVQALADGWYRIAVSITTGITSGDSLRWWVSAVGNSETAGIFYYLWGAQLEAASGPSSYIPTTTASATRAADSLTVTGVTGLDYPLTLFAEFERAAITGAASETYLAVDPAASTNEAFLYVGGTNLATVYSENGSTQQAAVTVAGATTTGVVYKMAARIATDSVQIARGGTLGTEDTVGTVPSAPSVIRFGSRNASGAEPYGYLRRAAIYASAKTDAQIQALTT